MKQASLLPQKNSPATLSKSGVQVNMSRRKIIGAARDGCCRLFLLDVSPSGFEVRDLSGVDVKLIVAMADCALADLVFLGPRTGRPQESRQNREDHIENDDQLPIHLDSILAA